MMNAQISEISARTMEVLVYAFQTLTLATKLVIFQKSTRMTKQISLQTPIDVDDITNALQIFFAITGFISPSSPRGTIDHLPAEILGQVFEYLSDDDILNLPHWLCAKGLLEKEGRCRFGQHHVWAEEKSVQKLVRFSRHPIIQEFVEELVLAIEVPQDIDLEIFLESHWHEKHGIVSMAPEDLSLENFHTLARIPGKDCQHCAGWPSLSQRWTEHRQFLRSFQGLKRNKKDIAAALRRLEHLSIITIDNLYRSEEARRDLGHRYFFNLDKRLHSNWPEVMFAPEPLSSLISAMWYSRLKLSSFRITGNGDSAWSDGGEVPLGLYPEFLFLGLLGFIGLRIFKNLRILELRDMCTYEQKWSRQEGVEKAKVVDSLSDLVIQCIIEPAASLEELTIHCTGLRKAGSTHGLLILPLYGYLGSNPCRPLSKLDLAYFMVSSNQFVRFLKAFTSTLKTLVLDDILLAKGRTSAFDKSTGISRVVQRWGTWEATFYKLKGLFQLQSLRLHSLMETDDDIFPLCEVHHPIGGDEEALLWLCGRSAATHFRVQ